MPLTLLCCQIEKAFQKQPIFQNAKARGMLSAREYERWSDAHGGMGYRWQEGLHQGEAVVQGCWSWLQDPVRGDSGHLHRYVLMSLYAPCTERRTFHVDKKCPFTGEVSIRGRILTGRVISTKMTRTIIIRRDYLHYIPKYSTSHCSDHECSYSNSKLLVPVDRYEKRHKNLAAHVSPAFRVEVGDVVTVGEYA